MEEIPIEIWRNILYTVEVSEVSKGFYSIAREVERPASSLDELKHFVECNYVRGITLSTGMVETYSEEIFKHSCKVKNKNAALYLKEFISYNPSKLYIFDDISIINNPKSSVAARYGAINILKEITEDPHYYIEAYAKLGDVCSLKEYSDSNRSEVILYSCKYNLDSIMYDLHVIPNDDFIYIAIGKDSDKIIAYFFEEFGSDNMYDCISDNAVKCVKWMLDNKIYSDESLQIFVDLAFRGGCLEMIKLMVDSGMKIPEIDWEHYCAEYLTEAMEYLLDVVEYDKEKVGNILHEYGYHILAYKLYPTEDRRLLAACENEDLDTVRELYPSYEKPLFDEFANVSYELYDILYRGEKSMFYVDTLDSVRFCYDKGIYSSDYILERYLVCGNSIEIIKFLIERGAVPRTKSTVPRVRKYLESL